MTDYSDMAFLPVKYSALSKYYHTQKSIFWFPSEIDFSGDRDDWDRLDKNTKEFLQFFLFFFAQFDGIVNENLFRRFKKETRRYKEASHFYAIQEANETIHNETYSLMIDTFIRDEQVKKLGFNAIHNYPSIKAIADWIEHFMDKSIPLMERVVAFACLEGVLFTGAFATIYWIKKRNILHALDTANQWIARDERLHFEFAVALFHQLSSEKDAVVPTPARLHSIIHSAVDVAAQFIKVALKVDLIGMNAEDLIGYVKAVANSLGDAFEIGHTYPGQVNPLDWMVVVGLPNKRNFFEGKATEYARQTESKFGFDLTVDF